MSKKRVKKTPSVQRQVRRSFPDDFKRKQFRCSWKAIRRNPWRNGWAYRAPIWLYRWKQQQLRQCGPAPDRADVGYG